MGAALSCTAASAEKRSQLATTTDKSPRPEDEADAAAASTSDCDDECENAVSKTTTPAQTQPVNSNKKTDAEKQEEEKKREMKKQQQEAAYRELRVDDVWLEADKTVYSSPPSLCQQTQRTGWHTVRIFVSSTFRDFHTERDVLVKKVPLLCSCFVFTQ